MLSNFIYTNPNSISKQLCDEIIRLYESEPEQYHGVTASGMNKKVKDTMDFIIPLESPWDKIRNFLSEELGRNITLYTNQLNSNTYESDNSDTKYKFFSGIKCSNYSFMVQRYIKQMGRYIYHHDSSINWETKQYRIVTFLWYLNTVEEGGETELLGTHLIKPEAGKLLLFPACWTFPHTGKMPISDNKYIITGWIYTSDHL
jgi:hypothetical protein